MTSPGEFVYRPPKQPDDPGSYAYRKPLVPWWVTLIGRLGKILIGAGLLVLAFVAYQLWGTNLQEARAQDRLRNEFAELLDQRPTTSTIAPATTVTPVTTATPTSGDVVVTTAPAVPDTSDTAPAATGAPAASLPDFERGDAVARIEIPKIGVDRIVVSGVSRNDLQKGPGHYPDTPMPGQLGNAAIAGHRTTYGAPFFRVNELASGDKITVTTVTGTYLYVVNAEPKIISPSDLSVLNSTKEATLTLTSCHPRYSAKQRIVITATLDTSVSSVPIEAAPATTAPPKFEEEPVLAGDEGFEEDASTVVTVPGATVVDSDPSTVEDPTVASTVPASAADQLQAGWFSEPKAWPPTILYALICFAIGLVAWWYAERWRMLPSYTLASVPFLVALYFFFENVSRLLPPNL
ncbi:MAG: class E sortase [Acidimicrobiia bacterium]